MKIAYKHLLELIPEKPSIQDLSDRLFQLGHEHNIENDSDDLMSLCIYAARYSTSQRDTNQNSSLPSSMSNYITPRCVVCGMTQKECHQHWRDIHDPNDPDKCPFRGSQFIQDKQIQENVLQYNIFQYTTI